jgi:putative endonuclease
VQNNSQKYGAEGEAFAANYLKNLGYEILERNWRFKKLEVDIIVRKGNVIAFVEVKTRKNNTFGEPEIFVTRKKQNFLIAAANHYIIENNMDVESRFDIIAISQLHQDHSVKHLEGAFYPTAK